MDRKKLPEALIREIHPVKNHNLDILKLSSGSGKDIWWQCKAGHEWEARVSSRALQGNKCAVCAGLKILKGYNDLATTNPEIAKEWHPTKNTKTVFETGSRISAKAWWLGSCGHEWAAPVTNRVRLGNGCPYCSGRFVIRGITDLEFKYPELAKEWNQEKNGDLKPYEVTSKTRKKVWWTGTCGHDFQMDISSRTRGRNCQYCSSNKILKGFNDLLSQYPSVAKEWHPTKNGKLLPDEIAPSSNIKVWWECATNNSHEWKTNVHHRTKNKGGCPTCIIGQQVSGVEKEIAEFVATLTNDILLSDRSILNGMEIDIYLPKLALGIEYNGSYWHSDVFCDENYHLKKWSLAKDKGVDLFNIWEHEWKTDSEKVKSNIKSLVLGQKYDPKVLKLLVDNGSFQEIALDKRIYEVSSYESVTKFTIKNKSTWNAGKSVFVKKT